MEHRAAAQIVRRLVRCWGHPLRLLGAHLGHGQAAVVDSIGRVRRVAVLRAVRVVAGVAGVVHSRRSDSESLYAVLQFQILALDLHQERVVDEVVVAELERGPGQQRDAGHRGRFADPPDGVVHDLWLLVDRQVTQTFRHGEGDDAAFDSQAAAEGDKEPETSGRRSRRRSQQIRKQQRSRVEDEAVKARHFAEDEILEAGHTIEHVND